MKKLISNQPKLIKFIRHILWVPLILFCAHLLISPHSNSLSLLLIVSIGLLSILLVIGKICMQLQKDDRYARRMGRQFIYGFLVPYLSIVTLFTLFDRYLVTTTEHRVHFTKDLLVIGMYVYVANSYHLVNYFDKHLSNMDAQVGQERSYHDKVVVYHEGAYIPVNLAEIALINQRHQINWLLTFKEEQHILDLSLKAIFDILGTTDFFKINRNQIVHKKAISSFRSGSFGKIHLQLKIRQMQATVSKDRAKDFREWFYT
ncbi:MAG: LytTR family transcriptional regulator DNA-binding domain-containing protein [Bacteroidia bacterium]